MRSGYPEGGIKQVVMTREVRLLHWSACYLDCPRVTWGVYGPAGSDQGLTQYQNEEHEVIMRREKLQFAYIINQAARTVSFYGVARRQFRNIFFSTLSLDVINILGIY
jgi:hypothetical protein